MEEQQQQQHEENDDDDEEIVLPPEVWEEVFQWVRLEEVVNIACVCSTWRDICSRPRVLESMKQTTKRAMSNVLE